MPVVPENLESVFNQIEKSYGAGSIRYASSKPDLVRISTGSLAIDYATGGGIPLGRIGHWYGNYGSGKTSLAFRTIANAQREGYVCALYNVEKRFNRAWAEKLGVDVDKLILAEGSEIETVAGKMEALLSVAHFHFVDSVASSASVDELASDVEDWHRALGARAWGKVIRRLNHHFDEESNSIILLNQVRSNMQYGGGEEPPGGKAINFASSLSLQLSTSSWLYYDKNGNLSDTAEQNKNTVTKKTEPDGFEFQLRMTKNTTGTPERKARYRVKRETGAIDKLWELVQFGIYFGIFERAGSWYSRGDKRVQGENGLREWISSDEELREEIKEKVLSEA